MALRLFFGVFPPREVLETLPSVPLCTPSFREVPLENRHVTLFFLGDVHEKTAEELLCACRAGTLPYDPFPTAFTIPGVFPDLRAPRVLWIGVSAHPQWSGLARVLSEYFSRWVPPVPPSFTPHLTLGRWKRPPSFSTVQRVLQEFPREGGFQSPWIVREVLLIRSQLTPRGSLYTPLATIPLRGAKGFNIVM